MPFLHYGVAIAVALLFALLLGPGLIGLLIFVAAGAAAAWLAERLPRGSERLYWGVVFVTLGLFVVSIVGANLGRLWLITPVVLGLCYFAARLAGGKPAAT